MIPRCSDVTGIRSNMSVAQEATQMFTVARLVVHAAGIKALEPIVLAITTHFEKAAPNVAGYTSG